MARRGRKYEDDDEINQSIRDFNASQHPGPDPNTEVNHVDDALDAIYNRIEDASIEQSDSDEGFGITKVNSPLQVPTIQIDPEDDGTDADLDLVVEKDRKPARVPKTINIPECSCCGAKWTMAEGRIRNGCGCRIHPTCEHCGKCKGHCACHG